MQLFPLVLSGPGNRVKSLPIQIRHTVRRCISSDHRCQRRGEFTFEIRNERARRRRGAVPPFKTIVSRITGDIMAQQVMRLRTRAGTAQPADRGPDSRRKRIGICFRKFPDGDDILARLQRVGHPIRRRAFECRQDKNGFHRIDRLEPGL